MGAGLWRAQQGVLLLFLSIPNYTKASEVIMQLGTQGNVSAFSRDRSETFRLLASGRQTADSGHVDACHDPIKSRIQFYGRAIFLSLLPISINAPT